MNDEHTTKSSPSKSTEPAPTTSTTLESQQQPEPDFKITSVETPQPIAGTYSGPTQPSGSPRSHAETPLITVTSPRSSNVIPPQRRPPVIFQPRSRQYSSQPSTRSSTPYDRRRSHSQPRPSAHSTTSATMSSSGSSPGNTSTAGSSSGSNITHLPYAPFPYPAPSGGQGGNSGK